MATSALLRRPMLPREFIDERKRERVARAVAEGARGRGLTSLTTAEIVARAHISRDTLYRLFPGRESCLRSSCEEATRQLVEPLLALEVASKPRRERVELGVGLLLGTAKGEPLLAELALVHSVTVANTQPPDRSREEVVLALAGVIGEDQIAELAARAIVAVVAMQLMQGLGSRLPMLREGLINLAGA